MAMVVLDNFTGTAGTDITTRLPDFGGAWSTHASFSGVLQLDGAGFMTQTPTAYAAVLNAAAPASADYDVTQPFTFLTVPPNTGSAFGHLARWHPTAESGYMLEWKEATGAFNIWKTVAGIYTSLGSYAITPALATYDTFTTYRGTAITFSLNGVQRISAVDSTYGSANKCGPYGRNIPWKSDSFQQADAPVAAVLPPAILRLRRDGY
jgi:hypothetical protein